MTSVGASVAQGAVGILGALEVGDLALLDGDLVGDGEGQVGVLDLAVVWVLADLAGGIGLVLGGIALLGVLGLAGEEDEALLVLLQALDVGLEGLLGQVLATRVDGNANGGRQLAWDASLL